MFPQNKTTNYRHRESAEQEKAKGLTMKEICPNNMRALKCTLLAIFLLGLTSTAVSQDVILKKDNTTILSKVLEITSTEIKYKKWSNQDGPTYSIIRSEVTRINFQNGEVEQFSDPVAPASVPQQPTVTHPQLQPFTPQPQPAPKEPRSPYSRGRVQFSLNGGVAFPLGKFGTTSDYYYCAPACFGGDELDIGYGSAKTGFDASISLHIPAYIHDKDIVGVPIKVNVLYNSITDSEKREFRNLVDQLAATANEHFGVYGAEYEVTQYPRYTNVSFMSGVDYTHYFTKPFGLFAEANIGLNIADIAFAYAKNLRGGTIVYTDYSNNIQYYSPDAALFKYKTKVNFAYEIGAGLFLANHISLGVYYLGYSPFQVCPSLKEVSNTYQMADGGETEFTAPKLQVSALSIQLGIHF